LRVSPGPVSTLVRSRMLVAKESRVDGDGRAGSVLAQF
jgi:hypothetical protein